MTCSVPGTVAGSGGVWAPGLPASANVASGAGGYRRFPATSAETAEKGEGGQHRQNRRSSSLANNGVSGSSYPGGKAGAGVYQRIINLMPPHEVYVEPFLGGGAVMRLKRPARLNIGVDLNPNVVGASCSPRRKRRGCRVALPLRGRDRFPADVSLQGHGAGVLRPALSDGDPSVPAAVVPARDDGQAASETTGGYQKAALCGDDLGLLVAAVRPGLESLELDPSSTSPSFSRVRPHNAAGDGESHDWLGASQQAAGVLPGVRDKSASGDESGGVGADAGGSGAVATAGG